MVLVSQPVSGADAHRQWLPCGPSQPNASENHRLHTVMIEKVFWLTAF